ncbi:MAG: bile acid:sodium symporter family protein [Bacteroidota bacterium]
MEIIDSVRINFSPDQLFLLNICLAFLMFGIALDIRLQDFRDIFRQPKAPFVGLFSQLILLPILTLFLIYLFAPPASIALGMILISVCPGGNVSNFMVHLAGANTALSVMLTSIVTLGAVVVTPISFSFWSDLIPGAAKLQQSISVSPFDMIKTIVLLIFLPLVAGMSCNHYLPKLTAKVRRPIRILSIVIFMSFVIVAMYSNYDNIIKYVSLVFLIVLVHNTLGFLMGYGFARLNRLSKRDARAVSIETGIQNSGLALILIFNFFNGIGGMAMIAAWWGIWHLISGFGLASWWASRSKKTPSS